MAKNFADKTTTPFSLFRDRSFLGLFISQSTGLFTDHALRMILAGVILASTSQTAQGGWLALLNAALIVPFILFAPFAGWIADRFSKRAVLIVFKIAGFVILALVAATPFTGNLWLLIALFMLMGTRSAFYSPAKYGILQEITGKKRLGQSNGVVEMGAILAMILGTLSGAFLYDAFGSPAAGSLQVPVVILCIVSMIGLLYTLMIKDVPSRTEEGFSMESFFKNLSELKKRKVLRLTIVGIAWFWFTAMFLSLLLILFGTQHMGFTSVSEACVLFLYVSGGAPLGCWLAGRASKYRVELGLIPIGSIGMGITLLALPLLSGNSILAVIDLVAMGVFGGLLLVPLNTLLQLKSGKNKRGRFIAISNLFSNLGMLLASLIFASLSTLLRLSPDTICILLGLFSLCVSLYIYILMPEAFYRCFIGILTHTLYRITSVNTEAVPETGPVLLTPNHMTFVDGLLLQYSFQKRKIRFVVYDTFFDVPVFGWILKTARCIPISETKAKDAILKVSDALRRNDVVCMFPEGGLNRIGALLPFKRGVELMLRRAPENTVVIPVCFDRVWGSIFSFKGKKFFWKWPEAVPYPVTVMFGSPLSKEVSALVLRQQVSLLGSEAFERRKDDYRTLSAHFIRSAKKNLFKKAVVDITHKPLTYLKLLAGSLLLSKEIRKKTPGETMIGLMLPSSTAAVLANISTGLAGKTVVNLNFSSGPDSLTQCLNKCEIKTIITSKLFIKKIGLEPRREFIYLEELIKRFHERDKILTTLSILLLPASLIRRIYSQDQSSPESTAAVIFSSGSTGDPKAIQLSHANIIAACDMMGQVMQLGSKDRMLGSLPFFHSFGYTATFWLPLLKGVYTAYAPNPLDAKTYGEMAGRYSSTIIYGTPTFYTLYIKTCTPEQFRNVRLAVAGAEKLSERVSDAFFRKYGVELLEGYGATEMSAIISCNIPGYSDEENQQIGTRRGSVGLLFPGLSAKITDPEDYDRELPPGSEGMLLVNGPNRMIGYYKDEERTKEVLDNGWYITGDMARFDKDGFLTITGRLSRLLRCE